MVSLLQPLVNIAVAEAGDQYDRMVNLKTELSSLKRIVSLIEGVLPEAEEKQVDNPTIRDWLRDLDDICYDARDILDEFVTVAASNRARRPNSAVISNPLRYFYRRVSHRFSTVISFQLRLRFRLANKIKKLRKRLDSMKEDMETGRLLDFVGAGCSPNAPKKNRPETGPSPSKDQFVGRKVEKEEIMEKLLNRKENGVEVVPIWGMGGVGKTTLAQSIYNDDRVTEELYPKKNRRWLFVGEKKFDAKEIMHKIVKESNTNDVEDLQEKLKDKFIGKKEIIDESCTNNDKFTDNITKESDTNDVEDYQKKLKDKFIMDRFLIVLDDVWDVGINEWKLFCNPLNESINGGLIIITTRTKEVINAIKTPVPYNLEPLSNKDCWQIFKSHAFTDAHSCSELEEKERIGKQIVEKLKGLPLAAEVVGRCLWNEPDVQIWRSFLEADEWQLSTGDDDVNNVMLALRWSYNRLPPHLKQCFTYCSLFPKDHVYDEKMLVEMWMAHGFIQNVEGGGKKRRPEDTGVLYFKQLVNAYLFQCVNHKYVMHDMIHDLAILVSNEKFLRIDDLQLDVGQLEKVRHMSIHPTSFCENLSLCMSKRSTLKRLLTLYTLPMKQRTYLFKNVIFKQLKSIRVLVLVSHKINYIPECISDLIHLRYLDIEKTNVSRIPDTLCDLHNLQTLVAHADYRHVTVMPKNIVNMTNLRHLRAHLCTCKGVKNLTSLQELHSIEVSKGDKISELGEMPQLRGELTIKCLENVTSEEDAAKAMMQEKTYIDHLELEFTKGLGDTDVETKVLDALQCPPNLRYLKIRGYNGLTSPSWMVDGELIKHLQTLHLSDCPQLKLLPPLGQLNGLKDLMFDRMDAINKLGEEFYGKQINENVFFPSLESLNLSSLENLKEWDDIVIEDTSVMFFPSLDILNICNCPKLVSVLPHVKICTPRMDIKDPLRNVANIMTSLSTLEILFCDGLVVLELDILVSLKHLKITKCSKLTRITSTVNVAATIETLSIKRCEKLEKMEFGSFSSLKILTVSRCNQLISFPCLVAIEELNVRECENLRSLSFSGRGLDSLKSLCVLKCPLLEILFEVGQTSSSALRLSRPWALTIDKRLVFSKTSSALRLSRLRALTTDNRLVFSKMFEHDLISLEEMCIGWFLNDEIFNEIVKNNWHKLTLLETLFIYQCEDLESLPPDIHKLSSLKNLCLRRCPILQALPADGLPLSLELLVITECPLLYERCQVESGADWNKIKHIPKRQIVQTISKYQAYNLSCRFPLYGLLGIFYDDY